MQWVRVTEGFQVRRVSGPGHRKVSGKGHRRISGQGQVSKCTVNPDDIHCVDPAPKT